MHPAVDFPITQGQLTADEIRTLVGKDDPVIVEVGANSGQTTVEMLKAMPGATIYAFEPDPRAIAKFRQAIPQHPRVHLFETAIGAVNGTITFHQSSGAENQPGYSQGWDQSGSIRPPKHHLEIFPWVKFENRLEVPITTLDSWAEGRDIPVVDFVWADVQGAESDMIRGGTALLRRARYVFTEYSNQEQYEGQATLLQVARLLNGFELIRRYPGDALFRQIGK